MTPQGYTFTQSMAEKFAKEDNLVILCGHYEGIDERALENIVTDFVSIGDYVLTGGELPAMVVIDTVSRLVQEFLIMKNLLKQRAFQMVCLSIRNTQDQQIITGKLFQRCFLSGHHANIEKWRHEKSLERTKKYRPDLYETYVKEHPDEFR